jgi:hypothetical protein
LDCCCDGVVELDELVPAATAAAWSSARWTPTIAAPTALADRMPTVQERALVSGVDFMRSSS